MRKLFDNNQNNTSSQSDSSNSQSNIGKANFGIMMVLLGLGVTLFAVLMVWVFCAECKNKKTSDTKADDNDIERQPLYENEQGTMQSLRR